MRAWYAIAAKVRSLLLRGRRQRDLDEELRLHLEQEIEQRVLRGVPPPEARRAALLAFGGVEKTKDECRDAWGLQVMDRLRRDVRYATRRLVRDWRFTLLAVLILALGIGVNTAMFSVVNALLAGPVPIGNPQRLVNLYQNDGVSGRPLSTPYPVYEDIAAYTDLYTGVAAHSIPVPVRFYREGAVRQGLAEFASASYQAVLGLELPLGRWFTAEEGRPGAAPVAVLTHGAWMTKFGAAPSVLGETVFINGAPVTVVGVGPEGYNSSLHAGIVADFWLSIPAIVSVAGRPDMLERDPFEAPFLVKARLRDGVSLPQAQAAMTALGARLARDFPDEDPGRGITMLRSDTVRIHPQFDSVMNYGASVLMMLVGLLLAIACSNLATWLLVRGLSRAREVSVRLALGATRGQIVRHLLVESTLLAGAGGAVGCVLAVWTIRVVALVSTDLPIDAGVGLDSRVLAFTLLLSLVTGVAFGLAPALWTTRVTLMPALRAERDAFAGRRNGLTLKNALVLAQVALSCVLLAWAGVFVQLLVRGQATDLGFDNDSLAFIQTDAGLVGHGAAEAAALYATMRDRIAALPGVDSATLAVAPPPAWSGSATELAVDGAPVGDRTTQVRWTWAGPGYVETLGIPLLSGRTFSDRDRPGAPDVAVVNETMARRYFGTPNAVGRRFRVEFRGASIRGTADDGFEVIGVVADTRTSLFDEVSPLFYRSFSQAEAATPTVVVRTTLDPVNLLSPMRQVVQDLGGGLPVIQATTMPQHLSDSLGGPRAVVLVLGGLGVLGLALATLGLYAVMAFAVSRQAREIGIRTALGAQRIQVIWAVSRGVVILLGAGVTTGLVLSWATVRGSAAISSSLSQGGVVSLELPSGDPLSLVLVGLLMGAVGLAAAFVPARRAARADPLVALREL